MGHAGEHPSEPLAPLPPSRQGKVNVPANDTLNMRAQPSASSIVVAILPPNKTVVIRSEAKNGPTLWFRVTVGDNTGWVAARFIKEMK